MDSIDQIVSAVLNAIDERLNKKSKSYYSDAEVLRVEGDYAICQLKGGEPETPARMTVDVKKGDTVRVHVDDHKATVTGNLTEKATGDGKANEAKAEAEQAAKKADKAEREAENAQESADDAQESADNAMTAANGKNKLYFAATAPSGGTYIVGDTWFDTANDNKIYHWDGSQWSPNLLGDDALNTFSANHINAGSIDASQVTISNLDAGNISSGKVAAQYIDAEHLKIGDMINDAGFITAGDVATWYTGTAITGTNTTPHIVSDSGIANAIIGDMYLNTSTNYVYQCTYGGTPSQALWKYVGDIEGDAGKGISSISKTGTSGNVDTYTITYTDGTTSTYTVTNGTDVTSQYVTTITGKTGIAVHMANDTSNYALVNSNGLYVYKSGNISAQFGRTITLYGRDNNGNVKSTVTIDSSSANINGFEIQTTTYTSGTFTECESSNGLRLIGAGTTLGLYSTQATLDSNLHISGVIDSFNVHQVASTCPTSRNALKTTYTELLLENYTSYGALVLGDYLSIIPWDEGYSYSGIKCLKAGYVLVSAAVHFIDVNDSNVCALKISAGSTDVAEAKARSSGDRTEIVIPPRLVSVSANTIIHLYVANTTTAVGYAGGNSSSLSAEDKRKNYLTVQYV